MLFFFLGMQWGMKKSKTKKKQRFLKTFKEWLVVPNKLKRKETSHEFFTILRDCFVEKNPRPFSRQTRREREREREREETENKNERKTPCLSKLFFLSGRNKAKQKLMFVWLTFSTFTRRKTLPISRTSLVFSLCTFTWSFSHVNKCLSCF